MLTDLRTCSFLTVDDTGGLEFIHRSYQEFFVARRIRRELLGRPTGRLRKALGWEYLYFLGSFGFTDDRMYGRFIDLARARDAGGHDSSDSEVANNAAQLTLIAREAAQRLHDFDDVVRQLGDLIQSAHFGPAAAHRWWSSRVRPMIDRLVVPAAAVDTFADRLREWSVSHDDILRHPATPRP